MIVLSMKWTVKKILVAAALFGAVVLAAVLLLGSCSDDGVPLVNTKEERLEFLSSLGWEVDPESEREREVVVPETFDEIYESYNELQKKAGFDLTYYKGKTVKRFSYIILNYPSDKKDDIIKLDLLVFDGRVIGGDVYSPRLDGFIIGLEEVEDATR